MAEKDFTYQDYLLEEIVCDERQDLELAFMHAMRYGSQLKEGQRLVVWILMEETDTNPFPRVTEGNDGTN
jgi:hypothetical protein